MLTEEQAAFVDAIVDQATALVACPGSGKTFTGVRRLLSRARSTAGIAYLSFTRVAVSEARAAAAFERVNRLLLPPNFVGTIDAFVRQFIFDPFISALIPDVPTPTVITSDSYIPPYVDQPANWVYDAHRRPYKGWDFKMRGTADGTAFVFGNNNAPSPAGITTAQITEAKRRYLRDGVVTHNDVLMWAIEILRAGNTRAGEIIARRFSEIIVDEAQDTSRLQQEIFAYLGRAGSLISYIGDPLQSIYTFNDADAAVLDNPDVRRFTLRVNKRSSSQIVTFVNDVYRTEMIPEFSTRSGPWGVMIISGTAEECVAQFSACLVAADIRQEDAAIVVRSNSLRNQLSGAMDPENANSVAVRRLMVAIGNQRGGDIAEAARTCLDFLRSVVDIAITTDDEREVWRGRAWIFLRRMVPAFDDRPVQDWLTTLRERVVEFAASYNVEVLPHLSRKLQRRGIEVETARDMLNSRPQPIRIATIHGVKGESIEAVLLVGSDRHHAAWLEGRRSEIGLLGYVGMTRARRLLVLGCPTAEIAGRWRDRLHEWQQARQN